MKFWRIVAGHDEAKSIILGDWLRKDYVSLEFGPEDKMTKKFEGMEVGDRVVVVSEGYVYAVGKIVGDVYEKQEEILYSIRRDVKWYRVTKVSYRDFPTHPKNKLQNRLTLVEMNDDDWQTLMTYLK